MSSSARDRIAERVKNAYAAGHNDGRKGRLTDRMDEVAETETGKILEVVREVLLNEAAISCAIDSLGNEFIGAPGDVEHMLSMVFDATGASIGFLPIYDTIT